MSLQKEPEEKDKRSPAQQLGDLNATLFQHAARTTTDASVLAQMFQLTIQPLSTALEKSEEALKKSGSARPRRRPRHTRQG